MKYIIFVLVLIIITTDTSFGQLNYGEEYYFIDLNASVDNYTGIPIRSKQNWVDFYSFVGDSSVFIIPNGSILFWHKSKDTLSMIAKKGNFTIYGDFLDTKERFTKYSAVTDPETFQTIVVPVYYYLPIRIGKWIFVKKNKVKIINYDNSFSNKIRILRQSGEIGAFNRENIYFEKKEDLLDFMTEEEIRKLFEEK
jgi:hypothetical protein